MDHKVPMCREFLRKSCEFSGKDCYYNHTKSLQPEVPYEESQEKNLTKSQSLGFWDPPSNLAPPSQAPLTPQGPSQAEWITMKTMLSQLNELVAKFK